MNFDLALRRGTVVINTAIVGREVLLSRLGNICRVFEQGYAMGSLVSLLRSGDRIGEIQVPQGMVGLCTVCSVTLNGVLLKHGIPTRSIFSGLLELDDGVPTRFSELINYDGSSVDPLQLFIRSRQTDYMGAITNGNGRIGAGFREIPEDSYDLAVSLSEKLEGIGLGAFMKNRTALSRRVQYSRQRRELRRRGDRRPESGGHPGRDRCRGTTHRPIGPDGIQQPVPL
jgi:repressor of nif and glnA expression